MRDSLGPYRILRKLGEGGMGVVYAAEDERLGRSVALKTIRAELAGVEARERLRREARAAARISHPNVCQLYEIGEADGELFIAMELLEGQPLSERIGGGPLPIREALKITFDMLSALGALHKRNVLHRDLKPSNVFLTEHGAKLLDFGVARAAQDQQNTALSLTGTGTILGTPRYMAPEYASGDPIDVRADIFAVGAILYEMLAGRPAFEGDTAVRVLHAVMYEQPPILTGSPTIAGIDRVVHRALSKQPSGRHASAEELADDLRAVASDSTSMDAVRARPMSRLIVLPFRLLRPDAEVDFLAFSLSDAVSASLSGLGSLIVRSSLTASKFGADASDLHKIAREADVDVVLSGTLLRAGDQVRLSAQLAEAPGGAIVWSHVMQVPFGDIFQLHDTLVHKLVEAMSIPLTAREHRLIGRDVPATAKAYEFYLRANEAAKDAPGWDVAVDLYRQCLDQDPQYAPAWARLGRIYRLMAKYRHEEGAANRARAEQALGRALTINPDLAFAHNVVAHMEVENGRSREAMARLLHQARQMSADPDLYAALCHVCRYCGLLDASVAAHDQAVRLDPKVATSVVHTYFVKQDYERVVECMGPDVPFIAALALAELGRGEEATRLLQVTGPKVPPRLQDFLAMAQAVIQGRRPDDLETARGIVDRFTDPEGIYYAARTLARLGEHDAAVRGIRRTVDLGYHAYPAFAADRWLDGLRGDPGFQAAMEQAKDRHEASRGDFTAAGGEQIVGVSLTNA